MFSSTLNLQNAFCSIKSTHNTMTNHKFAIIGGGIAGLSAAISLKQAGILAHVYEAAAEITPIGAGLALAANAIQAFDRLGIQKEVLNKGLLLTGLSVYDSKGKVISRADAASVSKEFGIDNFVIHRAALHEVLLANIDPSRVHLKKRINQITEDDDHLILSFDDGSVETTDFLIAADGINSVIRKLILPNSISSYSGYTCWRAVVDYPIEGLDEAAEYWGAKGRFGFVPLPGNKVYWYACVNSRPDNPVMRDMSPLLLAKRFSAFPEMIVDLIHRTPANGLIWNDIHDLPALKNYAYNNILLIGDAAHATTPNMGQGACMAIEDAVVLGQELSAQDDPWVAFQRFEKRRIRRTQSIVRKSRFLGELAQAENEMLIAIRNGLLRLVPPAVNRLQLKQLYSVDF